MTTPQLDIMHLKRSRHVEHYVHIVHSPTDALVYKKFAFDYFDSIMCSGEHQIESIRALEKKRGLPKKILHKTGLTYYDVMYREKGNFTHDNGKTILVAPTWGSNGMLGKFGIKPLEVLLKAGYTVILRPHPQMYISEKDTMEELQEKLSTYSNLSIDRNSSGQESMEKADIMISDISGIIFDFFFIYEKPIILIENSIEKGGLEAEDVTKEIWESTIFHQIATFVSSSGIDTLPSVVEGEIDKNITKNITKIRDQSLLNFACAGKVAANQLIEIIRK